MKPQGSIRLFQVAGITVYLHWIWFLIAYYQIVERQRSYSSIAWNAAEYLSLFAIVLLHEFGHAFATRQVGGTADTILLWPFGGVAYVKAPPRPGAELWSIAAGPLVNVVLAIPLILLAVFVQAESPDLDHFIQMVCSINIALLIFNILPVYPLDGGQMLRSLLWFKFGPIRSMLYATMVGFVGLALLGLVAFYLRSIFMGVMIFLLFSQCRAGYAYARAMTERNRGIIDV
jgi:Zn-dependent protease